MFWVEQVKANRFGVMFVWGEIGGVVYVCRP